MELTDEIDLAPGGKVTHPTLGIGKVISRDADLVRIYFKDDSESNPDRRVRQFRWPGAPLQLAGPIADSELDNLPP